MSADVANSGIEFWRSPGVSTSGAQASSRRMINSRRNSPREMRGGGKASSTLSLRVDPVAARRNLPHSPDSRVMLIC
jgi:hypothetical protein